MRKLTTAKDALAYFEQGRGAASTEREACALAVNEAALAIMTAETIGWGRRRKQLLAELAEIDACLITRQKTAPLSTTAKEALRLGVERPVVNAALLERDRERLAALKAGD
jgi:hypothetical protein